MITKKSKFWCLFSVTIIAIIGFAFISCGDDDESIQSLSFTKELIAADNVAWEVEDITIERGSSSYVERGRTLYFFSDGSCLCFHPMETSYKINTGKIATFYKETNEPIFVYTLLAQNDDVLKVRVDGTLDNDFRATITLKKIMNIGLTLEGTWEGYTHAYREYNGQLYQSNRTVLTFNADLFNVKSGTGYWVDYYNDYIWGRNYIANHISWSVKNGIIYIRFMEENFYIEIRNYSLNNGHFVGTIYTADSDSDIDFELYKTSDRNWNDYIFGFGSDY